MSFNSLFLVWLGILGCAFGSSVKRPYTLVGQNHCTWGPAYWCSHVAKAKECGAIEHCATVWGKLKFPEKAETCSVCESFIIGAEKLKENKIEMEKIGYYMDAMCSYFKGAEIQKNCQNDIVEYLPELFKLLELGMNAKSVCHTLNFCQKGRFALDHKAFSSESVSTTKASTTTTHVTTVSPDKICNDCKVFFTDVRQRLTSKVVVNNIEKVFDDEVCPYLGPFKGICMEYVSDFVPLIMQQLSMYIAPEFLCSLLTFCPMSKEAAVSHLMESIVHNNNLKDECKDCKMFLDKIKKDLTANTTTEELQDILKKEVCSHLGQYKEMCELVVDTYAGVIVTDLVEKINSSVVCHDIGVCSTQILIQAVADHFSKIKFSKVNPFREATECEMCKVLLKELHNVVEDKHVQEQITDFISNEVCSRLGDMKSSCLQLVMEYKPLIIKSIESLLDPVAGCTAVGMCTKEDSVVAKPSSMPMATLLPALLGPFQRVGLVLPEKPKAKDSEKCALCKELVKGVEDYLMNENVEKKIASLLDELCRAFPDSYEKTCKNFIDKYTDGIIFLLVKELNPDILCTSIDACTTVTVNSAKSYDPGCSYCTKIVDKAAEYMHIHPDMTENDLKAYMYKLCENGGQFTVICESAVDRYSQSIYNALKKGESSKSMCASLNFCSAPALKPQTEHFFVVMCEILKATGVNAECKDLATISKEIHAGIKTTSKELSTKTVKSSPMCYACKFLVNKIEEKIASKTTEEEIREIVDKMCDEISSEFEKECNALMNYEDDLIKLLEEHFTAEKICEMLHVCNGNQLKIA
ncbi:prosaposin isoform X2 [Octopus bimaculoides]|uniref:prosaposin isoform X2 n=1 Tax=Octopus bimaculoides TaxID=37653 RepID=UPI00071E492A|nr:prosaposin isoform X2 [Octopus bimaculoides]|eukprot:XP_014772410.1 PREDICTED: prosaposin-like isoform X2 [Octopus bimaculoides]